MGGGGRGFWSWDFYLERPNNKVKKGTISSFRQPRENSGDLLSLLGSMCTAVPRNPPPPRIWAHIRGRYWSAKIDDISLWPPILGPLKQRKSRKDTYVKVVSRKPKKWREAPLIIFAIFYMFFHVSILVGIAIFLLLPVHMLLLCDTGVSICIAINVTGVGLCYRTIVNWTPIRQPGIAACSFTLLEIVSGHKNNEFKVYFIWLICKVKLSSGIIKYFAYSRCVKSHRGLLIFLSFIISAGKGCCQKSCGSN